jgi:hypothetical protein
MSELQSRALSASEIYSETTNVLAWGKFKDMFPGHILRYVEPGNRTETAILFCNEVIQMLCEPSGFISSFHCVSHQYSDDFFNSGQFLPTRWLPSWSAPVTCVPCPRHSSASGCTKKSEAIPVTGREGLYGCETSRLPHLLDNRLTDGGKVVSLTSRPPFTPQEDSWYSFLLKAESTPGH